MLHSLTAFAYSDVGRGLIALFSEIGAGGEVPGDLISIASTRRIVHRTPDNATDRTRVGEGKNVQHHRDVPSVYIHGKHTLGNSLS
jgi:hypothetical protein